MVSVLSREWARKHEVVTVVFDNSCASYPYCGRIIDLKLPAGKAPAQKIVTAGQRARRLARLFRVEHPDWILSFMESANFVSIVAGLFSGCLDRLRVSVHTNPNLIPRWQRVLMRHLYVLPNGVITVSIGVRYALERLGVARGRVSVIPNPVGRSNAPARVFSSPHPARFILGVGRLHWIKGFDRLVAAFARLESRDLSLVILGDGTERSVIMDTAKRFGVTTRVFLPGAVDDVDRWYANAECFVLSSRAEGWGNVLVEAMANGCPVVSFSCDFGPAEIIDDGKSGILVAQDDVEGLARAVARILGDSRFRSRLVAGGVERAQEFVPEKIAPRWLATSGG